MSTDEITPQQAAYVARLARLALTDDELAQLAQELGAILGYMTKLNELDTSHVEPTASVGVSALPVREDVARDGLDRDAVLEQSPKAMHDGFAVPAFIEE